MRLAHWIGRLAADVTYAFRDSDWAYREHFVEPMFIKDRLPIAAEDYDDLMEDFATMWEDEWP